IFEKGIYPNRRPIHLWLQRQKYFIPYNELERIEIRKTTDGSKCIILYPRNWRQIVVYGHETGGVVFNTLLLMAKKGKVVKKHSGAQCEDSVLDRLRVYFKRYTGTSRIGNDINHGRLICEAPRREYIIEKVVGVIFTFIFSTLTLGFVVLIIMDQTLKENIPLILFYIAVCIVGITVIEIIWLPMVTSQRFRIYKNGITPHRRPFVYWLKKQEYFIPYSELENIEIFKTPDGYTYIYLYPMDWRQIVVGYRISGEAVFNTLLYMAKKGKVVKKQDPARKKSSLPSTGR
ncbi:MAG: hypothetical protein JSW28_00045, partial [Thermoplasmata archaeon]